MRSDSICVHPTHSFLGVVSHNLSFNTPLPLFKARLAPKNQGPQKKFSCVCVWLIPRRFVVESLQWCPRRTWYGPRSLSLPSPPSLPVPGVFRRSSSDGGGAAVEKSPGEYQLSPGAGDEIRQIHPGPEIHPENRPQGQGYASARFFAVPTVPRTHASSPVLRVAQLSW